MFYIVTAVNQTGSTGKSAASPAEALQIIAELTESGFRLTQILNENGQELSLDDLHCAADAERPQRQTQG